MPEEMLNIFDEDCNLIGRAPRSVAHREGLLHDVVHCWIVDNTGVGRVFFQQRAFTKSTFGGYYDIAVGGHISAGETPLCSVIREIHEEVGLELTENDLVFLGSLRKSDYFAEGPDREIGRVFLHICENPDFHVGEEVEQMVYITLPEFLARTDTPSVTAYRMDGSAVQIPLELWAGCASREFEDIVLPHITK